MKILDFTTAILKVGCEIRKNEIQKNCWKLGLGRISGGRIFDCIEQKFKIYRSINFCLVPSYFFDKNAT